MSKLNGVPVTCRRCGIVHRVNESRLRKPTFTGLCRDCFYLEPARCRHCDGEVLLNGLWSHERACKRKAAA